MANEVSYRDCVNLALEQIGYQGTSNTSKYSYDLDHADNGGPFYNYVKNGSASWCKIFCDWLIWMNTPNKSADMARNILCEPNQASNAGAGCTQSVSYFKSRGRYYTKASDATTGDFVFFQKSNGQVYHVGIIVDWDNSGYYVVEGNTNGNKVAKKFYAYSEVGGKINGFGRPDWYKYQTETPTTSTPTPTPSTPSSSSGKTYTVKVNTCLNVRSGPSTSYVIQGRLYNGQKVTVYEIRNGWGRIGERRWVSMNYLK